MRLTKSHRADFVDAVMRDVPKVDFETRYREQVLAAVVNLLPPAVRAVWENPETRHFAATERSSCLRPEGDGYWGVEAPGPYKIIRDIQEALDITPWQQQVAARAELESKLRQTALACNSRAELVDALPELEKYMPAIPSPRDRSLPVVVGVMSALKDAGWPT